MTSPVIQIDHLSHCFNKQNVLNDISLHVVEGSIYGFLGPNGAGKTTTLRLLLGLLKKQMGNIRLFEKDISLNRLDILRKTGTLIEQPSLYMHLNAKENLEVFGLAYDIDKKRIKEVLSIVRLENAGNKKVKAFSLGMKQRLAVALSLLPDPELLILDEPTNGLDPNGIIETRALIKDLNVQHGKTIVLSSHLLSEIEKMVTNVAIIHKGKILFQGTLSALHEKKQCSSILEIEVNDIPKAKALLQPKHTAINNEKLQIPFESKKQVAEINQLLVSNNIQVHQLSITQSDLEDLFIQIISQ